jgi:hypothetical protein
VVVTGKKEEKELGDEMTEDEAGTKATCQFSPAGFDLLF